MSAESLGLISHYLQLSAEPPSPSEMLQAGVGCDPFSFPIYVLLQTPAVYPGPGDAVHTGVRWEMSHSTHDSCLIPPEFAMERSVDVAKRLLAKCLAGLFSRPQALLTCFLPTAAGCSGLCMS